MAGIYRDDERVLKFREWDSAEDIGGERDGQREDLSCNQLVSNVFLRERDVRERERGQREMPKGRIDFNRGMDGRWDELDDFVIFLFIAIR